ncbi:MAG TPA: alpha-E domain-containing protein [Geminicoccaceae bacterium]|nr:alpha-E domain-containing protein [Geminicoccaceae bacterium]
MSNLLARYAESIFWLARYVERAENLARLIDVQETFSRDSRGTHDWSILLQLNADEARFQERHREASAAEVLYYYVLDRDNPTSIVANLRFARENARMLRPLISTEMWAQLNMFHNRIQGLGRGALAEERLARLCSTIKEGCDAHVGITAGTFYRDEAWNFYRLGAAIECADQTTRLLDVKFLTLAGREEEGTESVIDESQWTAVLRSAASYQAFRRRNPRGMRPEEVAAFLLSDHRAPRSVAHNLGVIEHDLTELRRQYGLRGTGSALEHVDGMLDDLHADKVRTMIAKGGLHQFVDWLQRGLIELTGLIGSAFFGYGPPEAPPTARSTAGGGTMSQTMGATGQTLG